MKLLNLFKPNIEKLKSKRDVKGLIRALRYKGDNSLNEKAAYTLELIGDETAVKPLIKALKHNYWPVRCHVVRALMKIGDARAVESLIKVSNDLNEHVRADAIIALGEIGDKRAIQAIVIALKDSDKHVAVFAAHALRKLGWSPTNNIEYLIHFIAKDEDIDKYRFSADIVAPLVYIIKNENNRIRDKAKEILSKIRDVSAASHLIEVLKDSNNEVRKCAVISLGKIGDSRAVEPLIDFVSHQDENFRAAVVEALGNIGDSRAVNPIIKTLNDNDNRIKKCAIRALEKIGNKRAVEPLIELLSHTDVNVRAAVINALGNIGDSRAVDPLIETLNDNDDWVKKYAIEALGKIGNNRAVEPLIDFVSHQDENFRAAVVEALGNIGDSRAVNPIIKTLNDNDNRVKKYAAEALGKIGDSSAVKSLILTCSKTTKSDVFDSSIEALNYIKWTPSNIKEEVIFFIIKNDINKIVKMGSVAIDHLIDILSWECIRNFRSNIVIALGEIGDERAIDPLIRLYCTRISNDTPLIAVGKIIGLSQGILSAALHYVSKDLKLCILNILRMTKAKEGIDDIIEIMKDEDQDVRMAALGALEKIGDPRTKPLLIKILKDASVTVRKNAARILQEKFSWVPSSEEERIIFSIAQKDWPTIEKIGERANKFLIELLKDSSADIRKDAVNTLRNIGDKSSIESFIKLLKDPSEIVRLEVVYALEQVGGEGAIKPLIEFLHDEDNTIRFRVAGILGSRKDKSAVEPLTRLLQDEYEDVIWMSIEALTKIGDKRAAEPISKLLKSKNKKIIKDAAMALIKIGDNKAVEPLIEVLKDSSEYIRRFSVEALGNIGDTRAIESLIELSKDADERVRISTAIALIKIGDVKGAEAILKIMVKDGYVIYGLEKELKQQLLKIFGKYAKFLNCFSYDIAIKENAVLELCQVRSSIADNILHLIADLEGYTKEISTNYENDQASVYEYIDFAYFKKIARDEVLRRGNPPYDPSVFLEVKEWKK